VTTREAIEGLDAAGIAQKLTIPESPSGFQILQFSTPEEGLASPVSGQIRVLSAVDIRLEALRVRHTGRADTGRRNNHDGAMMNIQPAETVLTGQWILQDGRPVADDVCKRILPSQSRTWSR